MELGEFDVLGRHGFSFRGKHTPDPMVKALNGDQFRVLEYSLVHV